MMKEKIDYPLLNQMVEFILSEEVEGRLRKVIRDIKEILQSGKLLSGLKGKICKKCVFFDLCMI